MEQACVSPHRRDNRRDYHFQEVSSSGKTARVRSFSLSQISTKDEKSGQRFQSTVIQISSFVSPTKQLHRKRIGEDHCSRRTKRELIPKAIAGMDAPKQSETSRHRHFRELTPSKSITRKTKEPNNYIRSGMMDQKWSVDYIKMKLEKSVFGQDKILDQLTFLLREFPSNKNPVFVFSGNTGTGKTYVSSVIYECFPWNSNKAIEFFDHNANKYLTAARYSYSSPNLLIIDDISLSDAQYSVQIVQKIMTFITNNKVKLMVFLIFRTQNESEKAYLANILEEAHFQLYHLPFNDLGVNEVKKCFEAELQRQKKTISEKTLNNLVAEHMKFDVVKNSTIGCKQVFHEVSLLP